MVVKPLDWSVSDRLTNQNVMLPRQSIKPNQRCAITVKLGDKEHFDKEQIGVKELFTDYQPFYTQ